MTFANFSGYEYSYTYVEYLANTYGWDAVKAFAKDGAYLASFGATEEAIYDAWTVFVRNAYSE